MRLADLYDSIGEITDERIISGSSFYVAPRNRTVRNRIAYLRKKGYKIENVGSCRFRCTHDPVSCTLTVDGTPFYNNPDSRAERYRFGKRGFVFQRVGKGVFKCTFNPFSHDVKRSIISPSGKGSTQL